MSMVGPDRIGIGMSEGAKKARKEIFNASKCIEKYEFITFPDDMAANCLYTDGNLVHTSKKVLPNSAAVIEGLSVVGNKYPLDVSELSKVDGCLTCSSLLIKLNN